MPRTRRRAAAGLVAAALLMGCDGPPATPASTPASPGATNPASAPDAVRVSGNRFVDGQNRPIRLLGFNLSGGEYSCTEGDGFFDTPDGAAPAESEVRAMRSWRGVTAVRVPLNEQCWLGLPAAPADYAGAAYRSAVQTFVRRLDDAGLVAVLDLHRSAPADALSAEQEPMPDRDHSPDFWESVAATFADRPTVVFDLFNEPYPFDEPDSVRAWSCWRDGGCTLTSVNSGRPFVAAGMNELIAAVRSTGAGNVVLAGGINWAESMTRWLAYRPTDPAGQLAASFHAYSFNTYCSDVACYERDLAPLAQKVPLFVGEIGPTLTLGPDGIDDSCPRAAVRGAGFAESTLDWLDAHGASWTAWSWNPWPDCWALVRDRNGNPTPDWGRQIQRRLAAAL